MHDLLEFTVVNRFPSCKPRGLLANKPRKNPLYKSRRFFQSKEITFEANAKSINRKRSEG